MRLHLCALAAVFTAIEPFNLDAQYANSFIRTRSSHRKLRRELQEECCGESCSESEVSEFYNFYSFSRSAVYSLLCEMSVREDLSCRCPRCGTSMIGEPNCRDPCKPGKFYCGGKQKSCIDISMKCDSDDDCARFNENWADEKNCKITDNPTLGNLASINSNTRLVFSKKRFLSRQHTNCMRVYLDNEATTAFGNIKIKDRYVCSHDWDRNDAKVMCRQLGFSSNSQAFSKESEFEFTSGRFLMDNVNCRGSEKSIPVCPHKTISSECSSNTVAGVVCIDPGKIEFIANDGEIETDNGEESHKGRVVVADMPVVAKDTWDKNAAKIFCKTKLGSAFKSDFGVPAFASDYPGNTALPAKYTKYCIKRVVCTGEEEDISGCSFTTGKNCNLAQISKVICAKCSPTDLKNILNGVRFSGPRSDFLASIDATIASLNEKCRNWNCSAGTEPKDRYNEYCQTRTLLEDTKKRVQGVKHGNPQYYLTSAFDPIKKLESVYLDQRFNQLEDSIFNVGRVLTKEFGEYYKKLAEYDKEIATADCAYAWGVWGNARLSSSIQQQSLANQLTDLFKYAYGVSGGDLVEQLAKVALATVALFTPEINLFGKADSALNLMGRIDDVMKKGVQLGSLSYLQTNSFPELKVIGNRIKTNVDSNEKTFKDLHDMFKMAETGREFPPDKSKDFIAAYNAYSPAMKSDDKTEYFSVLNTMLATICSIAENPDTAAGAIPALDVTARGICPKAKKTAAKLEAYFDQLAEQQFNLMDCFAKIARARIAEEAARSIGQSLTGTLTQQLEAEIRKLQVMINFRFIKKNLIKNACNFITYFRHGEEPQACTRLLDNPDSDMSDLLAFSDVNEINMCQGSKEVLSTFFIPATLDAHATGKVNIADLYHTVNGKTNGNAILEIPDKQWLVDNKWIYSSDNGPFFLQKMDIFLPPSSTHSSSIRVNAKLLKNTLNSKDYNFRHPLNIGTDYYQNKANCGVASEESLYKVQHCEPAPHTVCIRTSGDVNRLMYPSLEKSRWLIEVYSDDILEQPFPSGDMYLSVRAKFCYKNPAPGISFLKGNTVKCCFKTPHQLYNVRSEQCEDCANEAAARLNGYFCEKCPAGYTPRTGNAMVYGCTPCPVGQFKAAAGNMKCSPCPPGKTNKNTGSLHCYTY